MKLTTKNLLIVLAVLGIGYAITQSTKKGGRSKSLKSELVVLDTAKVDKIRIESPQGVVKIDKSATGWMIDMGDIGKKMAKQSAVTGLLTSLNTIKPGRLAAKTSDKWKDYAVDSTGTRVSVYEGDILTTDVVIGRFGVEGQQSFYTFVRLFHEEDVYVANGFMGVSIGKDASSFREGSILKLKKDSLTSMAFTYPDSSFTLSKFDQWYMDDIPVDSTSVAQFLSGLSFVNSKEFYDQALSDPITHAVTFTYANNTSVQIEGFVAPDATIIKSSENDLELFNDKVVYDKIFKSKRYFLSESR